MFQTRSGIRPFLNLDMQIVARSSRPIGPWPSTCALIVRAHAVADQGRFKGAELTRTEFAPVACCLGGGRESADPAWRKSAELRALMQGGPCQGVVQVRWIRWDRCHDGKDSRR